MWSDENPVKKALRALGLRSLAACWLALGSACLGQGPHAPHFPGEIEASRVREELRDFRLPRQVRPLRYELELDLDPSSPDFRGRALIRIQLSSPQDRIVLHAEQLDFDHVVLTSAHGKLGLYWTKLDSSRTVLLLPEAVSGEATLAVTYHGRFRDGPLGLYRVTTRGRTAIYSEFEPLGARRAFPCFDEPGFKTPFDVSLRVPKGDWALSNAPVIARLAEGPTELVHFASSAPLPSYLIGFAVGQFDSLQAPIGELQHSIFTLPGLAQRARYAAEQTSTLLPALSRYLGSPYPFAKLDQLAVPVLRAQGMEQPGLILYASDALLNEPSYREGSREWLQNSLAHELAHMWFGDQVTFRWWDDLWLAESVATWLSREVRAETAPEWESRVTGLASTLQILERDGRAQVAALRSPIRSTADIEQRFEDLSGIYLKGAAVVSMLEAWLGKAAFQDGLQRFLRQHAGSTADFSDFVHALEAAAGAPVGKVLQAFLERPGAPLLSFELRCGGGHPSVHHTQTLYRAGVPKAGVQAAASAPWPIPACLHLFGGDRASGPRERTVCALFEGASGDTPLDVDFCPEFFHPNADERGYYQWQLAPGQWLELAAQRARLTVAERAGLPLRALAAFEAGTLPADGLLAVLRAGADDEHSSVLDAVLQALFRVQRAWPEGADRTPLAEFARALLAPALNRLSYRSKPEDSPADRMVRPRLLRELFHLSRPPELLAAAHQLARELLEHPESIVNEDAEALLPIAASDGDGELYTELLGLWEGKAPWRLRRVLAFALGSFTNPELQQRGLDHWLGSKLDGVRFWNLEAGARASVEQHEVWWSWCLAHADAVRQRLGSDASQLPEVLAFECSSSNIAARRAHFAGDRRWDAKAHAVLDEALVSAEYCSAVREARGPALVAALTAGH